jgi:hypothetical protein
VSKTSKVTDYSTESALADAEGTVMDTERTFDRHIRPVSNGQLHSSHCHEFVRIGNLTNSKGSCLDAFRLLRDLWIQRFLVV